jgi:hypothetical protein
MVAMSNYKNCPNCTNIGFNVYPNHYTGEPEQEQCQFCYEDPDSIFNYIQRIEKQLAEATARADDAEGINLAVTEQMKIIASFTDNTASVKAKGIEEALHHVPFPQDMPSTDAALLAYDNNLLNYAKSLEGKQ